MNISTIPGRSPGLAPPGAPFTPALYSTIAALPPPGTRNVLFWPPEKALVPDDGRAPVDLLDLAGAIWATLGDRPPSGAMRPVRVHEIAPDASLTLWQPPGALPPRASSRAVSGYLVSFSSERCSPPDWGPLGRFAYPRCLDPALGIAMQMRLPTDRGHRWESAAIAVFGPPLAFSFPIRPRVGLHLRAHHHFAGAILLRLERQLLAAGASCTSASQAPGGIASLAGTLRRGGYGPFRWVYNL